MNIIKCDGYVFYEQLNIVKRKTANLLSKVNAHVMFDTIFAHEMYGTAHAGLTIANEYNIKHRLLDVVEFPLFAGRSAMKRIVSTKSDVLGLELLNNWYTTLANKYDTIFTSSDGQKDTLTNMGVYKDLELLRNVRTFQSVSQDNKIRNDCLCSDTDVLILHANNVYPLGGAVELIESMQFLPKNYKLCILGNIREIGEYIVDVVHALNLQDRIKFIDPVNPSRLIEYISGADISVIPLRPEVPNHIHCLPNRLFESLSAQIPVVSPSEIEVGQFTMKFGLGEVFDKFDPISISSAIRKCNNNKINYVNNIIKFNKKLNWHSEFKVVYDRLQFYKSKRILLIASKKIERNDRICRLSQSVIDLGCELTVISNKNPVDDLKVSGVNYID